MNIKKGNLLTDRVNCIHFNLRKAMRAVTQHYDTILQPVGLRGTQFSILSMVSALGQVSITDLADRMVIDRTTLTRNLKPLVTANLLEIYPGEDRRVKVVKLTPVGRRTLKKASPYWEEAQSSMLSHLGKKRARILLEDLTMATSIGEVGQ
ncbi:MAG: MarR family transcriptional regulator [Gammaproteobacteria bacterium]|nr:MAG: MarR family transcriptional regulator [Gammaproteobacteria bacterium]